jgi:hypothetical protein
MSIQSAEELHAENLRLRAALATSEKACVYCQLPADKMAECKSGFPGCGRMDDITGCPEFGAAMSLSAHIHEAEAFVEFVLRHTWPERATAHGAEAVHSIIKHHPFATEHSPKHVVDGEDA